MASGSRVSPRSNGARVIVRSFPPLKGSRSGNRRNDRGAAPQRSDISADAEHGWLWGAHAVLAAAGNPRRRLERLLVTRNAASRLPGGVAHEVVEPALLDRLLPQQAVHQGFALKAASLEPMHLEEVCLPLDKRPIVVLDQVTDPQNVGAIFRSAAAFGARGIVLQDRKSPPLTGALAKAAVGAVETVPHARVVNIARSLEEMQNWDYLCVGLAGEADLTLAEAVNDARPIALVIGAEGAGLRQLVGARCERLARIPISPEMESLNASVAAAIALYEIVRVSA